MPRVCIRKGCGTDLLKKDGSPDYGRRRFCSGPCRRADGLEKLQLKRATAAKGKCPTCGRRSTGDARFSRGVSQNTPHKTGVSAQARRGTAAPEMAPS
jgi:hypothetical protein